MKTLVLWLSVIVSVHCVSAQSWKWNGCNQTFYPRNGLSFNLGFGSQKSYQSRNSNLWNSSNYGYGNNYAWNDYKWSNNQVAPYCPVSYGFQPWLSMNNSWAMPTYTYSYLYPAPPVTYQPISYLTTSVMIPATTIVSTTSTTTPTAQTKGLSVTLVINGVQQTTSFSAPLNAGYTYVSYFPIAYYSDRCEINFIDDKGMTHWEIVKFPVTR